MYMYYIIYINIYIGIQVYTRPEISLFLWHPVTVCISDPHPPLPNFTDCYLRFLPFVYVYARCSVKLFSFSFFFLSFIFFIATFRIVSAQVPQLLVAVGHASTRFRPTAGWVARGRGAPPLECGPRVLSSTSSSPVSSDTSFGWCSTHESFRVYLFCAIIIIVFTFFLGRGTTHADRVKKIRKKTVHRNEVIVQ